MPDPETLDPASLDTFTTSLIEAGFVRDSDGRTWHGPIHPALKQFSDATHMRVVIRDGWPFLHPRTYADGIPNGLHRTTNGDVCLWEDGDPSFNWLTWDGISARIEQWAEEAQGTGTTEDPGFDPHVYFFGVRRGLATIDLSKIRMRDWKSYDVRATLKNDVLAIGEGELRGRLYMRDRPHLPARNLDELRAALRVRQQRDLDRRLTTVGQPGGLTFIIMVWSTPAGYNLLVLGFERPEEGRLSVTVYEPARTDTEILKLRAGLDASGLADNTVVLFGAGAIGSHIADLLTRSGVGTLHVHDTQRLRPGDVVRHAADRLYVGDFKTDAVRFKATLAAPWSAVRVHRTAPWKPSELAEAVAEADLAVDATGLKAFAAQLSLVCANATKPMISAASYRHGELGRVRVQAGQPNDRIYDRAEPTYPQIPRGAEEAEVAGETGCAAPVAQAPPAYIAAISATAARWAVDVLTGRADEDADVIEVYHPLVDAPFNRAGTSIFRR
jgi:hypothetical protein